MEARLYRLLCLAGVFLSLGIILPVNLIIKLPGYLNLTVTIFGLACGLLYWLIRRQIYLLQVYALLLMATLDACWFQNAGSQGAISMFLFTAVMVFTVFFRGAKRWAMLSLFLINGLALIWVDAHIPRLIVDYPDPSFRLPDLATGFGISMVACLLIVWTLLESYDRERARLARANTKLEQSLQEIQTLRGLLPICSWCKKIRDDEGLWQQTEDYIAGHSAASFTHGVCPDCAKKQFSEYSETELNQRLLVME